MNWASCSATSRPRRLYFSFARTTTERPSGVSSARLESWAASASSLSLTPSTGMNFDGLPIPQSDGSRLIQKQGIYVARSFDCLSAHGQNVVLHHAIHTRDADGGKQSADGRRDQAHQQGNQNRNGWGGAAANGENRILRIGRQASRPPARKISVKPAIKMLRAISFGVFLAHRALDQERSCDPGMFRPDSR